MYIIGRGKNGQATLMHKLVPGTTDLTLCGRQVNLWSRSYQHTAIREIYCLRCQVADKKPLQILGRKHA